MWVIPKGKNMDTFISQLVASGLGHVAAYLAAHVLLCLLPAFYIAGAMTALIPKETVTRYLGRTTPKVVSYPAAAAAGFLLAVCSCTVMPLFAGIYKKGAGLGPAITFLFVAPAINVLAVHRASVGGRFCPRPVGAIADVWHSHWPADGGAVLAR